MLFMEDLQKRLETIKISKGYPLDVLTVKLSPDMSLRYNAFQLPLIEIILGDEEYEQKAGGNLVCFQEVILRLVAKKTFTDDDMANFKSAVIRCIFCDSYLNQGNAGSQNFGNDSNILQPKLMACVSDLNMIEANRIWNLLFKFQYITHTYRI